MSNYEFDEVYTARDVARICRISEGRVRYRRGRDGLRTGSRLHFHDLAAWAESELIGARLIHSRPRVLELDDHVRIIPGVNSGRPSVCGIRTDVIAARYAAGESINSLSRDYMIPVEKIEAAIQWEAR